jgi:hypothetical protein
MLSPFHTRLGPRRGHPPPPGQVTVRRIHWPSDGTESKARIALLAATSLTPVGGLSRR